ncbi:hypothetical protein [Rhizobium sp. AG855]|uniref:hypothetical protein n=1 Tax=Rhizobium sp. AG855 TaxID=2183898 RepID=UPI000E744B74|nr:hypothetical protein [Rhizobium sp. AG855]RKE86258.1 hypothetical protein DFO46_3067 [Rhizobium sp. AG855]
MAEQVWKVDDVFGVSRDVPGNYVARTEVDGKLIDSLTRDHHIVIYGSSKQGKTCLRKHCLNPDDFLTISCQNKWGLPELHSAILKEAGYVVRLSTSKTVSGTAKISALAKGSVGLPVVAKGSVEAKGEGEASVENQHVTGSLELDPSDANDIIRALEEVGLKKFIVLEDFHYLPEETQRDFAFALKAFHEKSKICFVITGVWREENRLIAYNGDLTERVYSVDVDTWNEPSLREVIAAGEALLCVQFTDEFKDALIANCFNSVHLIQEACRRMCRKAGVFKTSDKLVTLGTEAEATSLIKEVVNEQRGRYEGFLMNVSDGFQQTDLEMPRWIIFAILTFSITQLEAGIRLREISKRIKANHPKGENLNNGNITQALASIKSLQNSKGVRPIVLDYDGANRNLHVVDKGFLIWLATQDMAEILEDLSLPTPKEVEA